MEYFFKGLAIVVLIFSILSMILPRFMDEPTLSERIVCLIIALTCGSFLIIG